MMKTGVMQRLVVTATTCGLALTVMAGCSASQPTASETAQSVVSSVDSAESQTEVTSSSQSSSAESSARAKEDSSSTPESSSNASSSSDSSSSASTSTTENTERLTEDEAKAAGFEVFTGTVRVLQAEELLKLQKSDLDPSVAGGGGTYAVLVFDGDTEVVGMGSDGSGERTEQSKMLGIAEYSDYGSFIIEYGDLDLWKSLDGKQASVAARAEDIWFPSDARLPLGEPYSKAVIKLS